MAPTTNPSKNLLDYYHEDVIPSSNDKKKSKALVNEKLRSILDNLDEGRSIYNGSLEGAGSSATNTKVNKADEFDMTLHLNVGDIVVDDSSEVTYRIPDELVCRIILHLLKSLAQRRDLKLFESILWSDNVDVSIIQIYHRLHGDLRLE